MNRSLLLGVVLGLGLQGALAQSVEEFGRPPEAAKAMTWWHWMQGNVSREGITADLEAMKRVGIGGALIFHVGQLPIEGKVKFLSPEWWELMRFAGQEAERLGLRLGVHNCPGWSASGGPWVKVEQSMQKVVWSEMKVEGGRRFEGTLARPKAEWNYYRDIAVLAVREGDVTSEEEVVELTGAMDGQGKLTWEAPEGNWAVLRIGHTTTGTGCHPAPPGGWGLECDKMSKEAVRAHFEAYPAKLLEAVGKSLSMIEIDSYEAGDQNWTPKFGEEFLRRRGYAITPWLAVLAGKKIGSEEKTARFKEDMRRTVAELFAENYYGTFGELVRRAGGPGVQFVLEPYGGPFDTITAGGKADLVMGEFWVNGWYSVANVASAAHVHGQKIVAAEAFTGSPDIAQWRQDPSALKAPGDKAFALGVNQMVLHTMAHQPWGNAAPGMTMGWWGTHFGRTQTWWEQSGPWFTYLARCQYMLQQGRPVVDVLALGRDMEIEGYRADRCDEETVMRLKVEDGKLVLPHGMSYRLLVLPDSEAMTPALAGKVRDLVRDGATLLGRRPTKSVGLGGGAEADGQVAAVGREVWDEKGFGRGKAVASGDVRAVVAGMNCAADVVLREGTYTRTILWTHRQTEEAEIYFVSNQRAVTAEVWMSFRVAGRQPEIWDAETGRAEAAAVWQAKDGRTEVLVQLPPAGSAFVVFRKAGGEVDPVVDLQRNGESIWGGSVLPADLKIIRATYGVLADPAKQKDVTAALQERINNRGGLAADNTLAGDPAPMVVKQLRVTFMAGGRDKTITVRENDVLEFGPAETRPVHAMLGGVNGRVVLQAASVGEYTVVRASGRRESTSVREVPAAVPVEGAWELLFPAGSEAPGSVRLKELVSWTMLPEAGAKYFSGTATYRTRVIVPAEALAKDVRWELDLGEVKNLAEVRVNGVELGVLWKAPFEVDVTKVLKAGVNEVEVRVTNLWPNRLIGDEQEADDCQWGDVQYWDGGGAGRVAVGRPLAKVPEWLLKGEPRPSAGRKTLTTWKFYEKDSPLLPSGLLGPVRLVGWKQVEVR